MSIKSVFFCSSLMLVLSASAAYADGQRSRGMTQLDFDQPAPATPVRRSPTGEQINQILDAAETAAKAAAAKQGEPAQEVKRAVKDESPDSETASSESKTDSTARASLDLPSSANSGEGAVTKFDWERPQEGTSHFLIPRLKGPSVDSNDNRVITTAASWRRSGAVACQDVAGAEALCNKAKALKEVTFRFSGSDEFFDSQCQRTCPKPEQKAVLTGFAVKAVAEGEFRMTDTNKVCKYQIRSNVEPPRWQLLQGERGTCTCLAKSCS